MRKVFLEDLPTTWRGIDWAGSVGYNIKFIYDDIKGEIEIITYNLEKHVLSIKYLDNDIFKILTDGFAQCQLGKLLKRHTHDFKIQIGQTFKSDMRDMTVIGREYRREIKPTRYLDQKYYEYECNICGYKEGWITESNLLSGIGCGCCHNLVVVEGINDIPTTAPELVKFFQNPEDAKLYTKSSNQKIKPICPDCGKIKAKEMPISRIYDKGMACSCSDGISYPEKLTYGVLDQLNILFETQLSKSTFKWCMGYRYDFYIPSINAILEINGRQHYEEHSKNSKFKMSLREEIENDKAKQKIAEQNGISEYIIIDCSKSDLEFIKTKILGSRLNGLLNLNNIDWNKCEEFALSNLVKKACELKRDNPNITSSDIASSMNFSITTIISYLKRGTKIWDWCNYDPKEEMRKCAYKLRNKSCKQVEIFKDEISIGILPSTMELERQSEKLFGVKLEFRAISAACLNQTKLYKGFSFKYTVNNN